MAVTGLLLLPRTSVLANYSSMLASTEGIQDQGHILAPRRPGGLTPFT
jgi:hypothetical protein